MLQFAITQHIRDATLMLDLQEFFGCYVGGAHDTIAKNGPTKKQFRILSFPHITNNLLPLFELHPLCTQKALDMQAFSKVHGMMVQGMHLTPEGLEQI